jgi:hypothetical protein
LSKGFLVIAQNNADTDYVKQAYALALSIRYSQINIKSVSVITNDIVPDKYKTVFDNIIPIPFNDDALNAGWKVENRWKLFHASPYDETIVLDTDMLVLEDLSAWWNYCQSYDLRFCSRVINYKKEVIDKDIYHRQTFIQNQLSNPYFALHYFKKSDLAYEFYKVLEFVCNNWEWCWTTFAPEYYQKWLSMDLAAAVAIEIMGCHDQVFDQAGPLEFIHMKAALQNWFPRQISWQDTVPFVLNTKGDLIVGNMKQSKLFHYVEKDFLTDNVLQRLEWLSHGTT